MTLTNWDGRLVCLRCRDRHPNSLAALTKQGRYLVCDRCQAHYPILDSGSPVLLRDPDWRSERSAEGEAKYVAQFVYGQFPDRAPSPRLADRLSVNLRINDWFTHHLAAHTRDPQGTAIELGCGPGGYAGVWSQYFAETILCDIRTAFVEQASTHASTINASIRTLVCDARDIPLRSATMAMVAAIHLLDVAPDPMRVLQEVSRILQPEGLLAVAIPYAGNFTGPAQLLAALSDYEILASEEWMPWIVPVNDRLVYEYQTHLLLARKR